MHIVRSWDVFADRRFGLLPDMCCRHVRLHHRCWVVHQLPLRDVLVHYWSYQLIELLGVPIRDVLCDRGKNVHCVPYERMGFSWLLNWCGISRFILGFASNTDGIQSDVF